MRSTNYTPQYLKSEALRILRGPALEAGHRIYSAAWSIEVRNCQSAPAVLVARAYVKGAVVAEASEVL